MCQIPRFLDFVTTKLPSITERERFIDMANCAIRYAEDNNIGNGDAPNWTTDAQDSEIFTECVTEDVQNEFASFLQSQTNGTKIN